MKSFDINIHVEKLLSEVANAIEMFDFDRFWPGFVSKQFALYTGDYIWFKEASLLEGSKKNRSGIYYSPWNNAFFGNTAIYYKGNYVAIWNIESEDLCPEPNRLAALIVHEMFHAHQKEVKETRWQNEVIGADYPKDKANVILRALERKALLEALYRTDVEELHKSIGVFLSYRKMREDIIGNALEYEKAVETIEGTATYIEYLALTKLLPRSKKFLFAKFLDSLNNFSETINNLRHSCYSSGHAICLLLDRIAPDWKMEFETTALYASEYLESIGNFEIEKLAYNDDFRADQLISLKEFEIKNAFDGFRKIPDKKAMITGEFVVTGLDPLNLVREGDLVLHPDFLKVTINGDEATFKGPLITKIKKNIFDIKEITILKQNAGKN